MTKLLSAMKRTLGESPYSEPPVHFHQGTTDDNVEVCHEGACARPRLSV
jgi:hypothetical protein